MEIRVVYYAFKHMYSFSVEMQFIDDSVWSLTHLVTYTYDGACGLTYAERVWWCYKAGEEVERQP